MLAIPPAPGGSMQGRCYIIITATEDADAYIYDHEGLLAEISIPGGTSEFYNLGCHYRTAIGLETRGVRVQSTAPVSILVFTEDRSDNTEM